MSYNRIAIEPKMKLPNKKEILNKIEQSLKHLRPTVADIGVNMRCFSFDNHLNADQANKILENQFGPLIHIVTNGT